MSMDVPSKKEDKVIVHLVIKNEKGFTPTRCEGTYAY
jgi:hypothetical protein